MAVPVNGRATVAVLVGGVHGLGASEAQGPEPQAPARNPVPVRVGAHIRAEAGGGAGLAGARDRKTQGQPSLGYGGCPCSSMCAALYCVSGPATRPCVRVLFVAWEGRAAAPAVNSAPRDDRLLPFLLQGKRPIEHGHGCGLQPLAPGLALRVDRPRFNQDRFDCRPSLSLCDDEWS